MEKKDIQRGYNQYARQYDLLADIPEFLGVRNLRRSMLQRATGAVLEVAVGTGKNLPFYPRRCRIIALDFSSGAMALAGQRATRLGGGVTFVLADGESLPFADGSFDTVVDSLSMCTLTDPVRALREMARVCRPRGRILLLEHGRSDWPRVGRWQDRRAERHAKILGCWWNREPLEMVREAGLTITRSRRSLLGMFHEIEVQPALGATDVTHVRACQSIRRRFPAMGR